MSKNMRKFWPAGGNIMVVLRCLKISMAMTVVCWGVTNSVGATTSSESILSGLDSGAIIAKEPTNRVASVGAPASLSLGVAGHLPISYQLLIDGSNFAEALDTTNLVWTTGGDATWFAQGTNSYDGVAAASSGPISTNQQSTLQTTVTGPGTLSFWWNASESFFNAYVFYVNGIQQASFFGSSGWQQKTIYLGAGSQTLLWKYINAGLSTGQDSGTLDQVAFTPGITLPTFTTSPTNQTLSAGATANFAAEAIGTPPLIYQWQFNGAGITGATNSSFCLTNVQASDAGNYALVVTNAYGKTNSSNVVLTINNSAPVITAQPVSQAMASRGKASFQVLVQGSEPLFYQWLFNGINILGATNPVLSLANLQMGNAGTYQLIISNSYGSVYSSNATLTVGATAVLAWGYNGFGQTNIPVQLTNVTAIAAGGYHNLALTGDGSVIGWGRNLEGQINVPSSLTNAVAICGGEYHSMALRRDGSVCCWGWNQYGQTNTPIGLSNVTQIAAGFEHSLALKKDGTVIAWGYNQFGQTNIPSGLSNVVAIAGGGLHSLALKSDGTVVAWGYNQFSQTNVPPQLSNVVAIAGGENHSLAIQSDGTVVIWGDNQLEQTNVPPGILNAVAIAGGESHSMVLQATGSVVVWKYNYFGQTNIPVVLTNATAIASGLQHCLALVNDGSPSITRQPLNVSAAGGADVTLSTGVTGLGPLSYQWQLNGTNIAGATNPSLSIPNVAVGNQGSYSVVVSNMYGSVTSSNAALTVLPLPSPLLFRTGPQYLQLTSDGFKLQVTGATGPVIIYSSTNLLNWQPVCTNSPTSGTVQYIDSAATNSGLRFYRAVQQ